MTRRPKIISSTSSSRLLIQWK